VRVAVVGHVEHVEFLEVARLPKGGEIVHAKNAFSEAAGGGGVAAVQLRKLAGNCALYTALGDDARGHESYAQLGAHGVDVKHVWRTEPQRRGVVFLDDDAERTITIIGKRHQLQGADFAAGLDRADFASVDAVYFTAGDADVLRIARAARVLVATSRVLPILDESGVQLDAVVRSANDKGEPDPLAPATRMKLPPRLVASTEGGHGGRYVLDGREGRWASAPLPGPPVDAYGCGDSFAAGLTFALGSGMNVDDALAFAAKCGAACLTGRGPYAGQLRLG
jgi:ribokinase